MASRAELKVFGLKEDAKVLRDAAKIVRRRGWDRKFAQAMVSLAVEVELEIASLEQADGGDGD